MSVELIRHSHASRLLSDEGFRSEWDALCERCPWATAFQSHRFARVWFSTYLDRYEPLLLASRSAGGPLQGLLVLARSPADGSLCVVGGCQAEYQAWVCDPGIGQTFPEQALATLRRAFPETGLTFRYLPAGTPTAWLAAAEFSGLCLLRKHRRPVWEFAGGEGIAASLKKANNKNRVRQLKKLGPFEFTRVTDPAEFGPLFDEMVELYDLRHGAVHGALPFCSIDRQKEFHVALLAEPGLMHATVLRAGGNLAAAHFGICSRTEVHFGTVVHDPRLAKHSPGKLQFLLLAQMLHQEGFRQADLTPGDDAYKERHATAWDDVHSLSLLPTAVGRARASAALWVSGVGKRLLKQRGMTACEARHRAQRLRRPAHAASSLVRGVRAWAGAGHETRIYLRDLGGDGGDAEPLGSGCGAPSGGAMGKCTHLPMDSSASPGQHGQAGTPAHGTPAQNIATPLDPSTSSGPGRERPAPLFEVRRDAWSDLLAYRPTVTGLSRQAFLAKALARLEAGEHAYTASDGGRLIYLAWMAERPSPELLADVMPGLAVPADAALVQDLYLFDEAPRPLAALALRAMLRDARKVPSVHRALVLTTGDNGACRYLLESTGFMLAGSIHCETRFGRRRFRIEGLSALTAAAGPAAPVVPLRQQRLRARTPKAELTA